MFREAIELLRGVVGLKGFRPGQSCNGFPGSEASVGHAYRLIPEKLNRIPIALNGLSDQRGTL